jgi:hypothetical protein
VTLPTVQACLLRSIVKPLVYSVKRTELQGKKPFIVLNPRARMRFCNGGMQAINKNAYEITRHKFNTHQYRYLEGSL